MGVLKGICYIVAAIAVLTVIVSGGVFIILAGIAVGLLLDVIGAVLFTATGLRAYFKSK